MPKKKELKQNEKEIKITCLRCGTQRQASFYVAKDQFRDAVKKVPYCKACVRDIYDYYLEKCEGNINLAVYFTCRKIDVPYIHSNFEGAMNNIKNPSATMQGVTEVIPAYFKGLAFSDQNHWGYTFDDSQGEENIAGLAVYDNVTKIKKNKSNRPTGRFDPDEYDIIEYDTAFLQQKWGMFPNSDLAYLEGEYLDWADKLKGINDKSTDIMVKEVCLQCNEIRKGREMNDNVEKKIATLQSLLKTSGLIEKQDSLTSETCVGMGIEDIENQRPIKTVDPDLDDVDNIRKIIIGFAGGLSRALGKENAYTEEFDEIYGDYNIDIIDELKQKLKEEEMLEIAGMGGDTLGETTTQTEEQTEGNHTQKEEGEPFEEAEVL